MLRKVQLLQVEPQDSKIVNSNEQFLFSLINNKSLFEQIFATILTNITYKFYIDLIIQDLFHNQNILSL